MSDEKFDVIVVGGGLSGLTAAYVTAQQGLEVLLVDRGNYSGSKNVTGGRLYGHSLEKIIPGFAEAAPVERKITHERFSYFSNEQLVSLDYGASEINIPGESYSVLRGKFDRWLSEQTEENGAMLVYGVKVDDVLIRDNTVCGIRAGDEEMEADVVILADGVNSLLAQKAGIKEIPAPDEAVVGVKEVIELGADTINRRFGLSGEEGLAWMFNGCCTDDRICDGFIYTNRDSISLGITMKLSDIDNTEISVPQMLEDFKNSEHIAPLVEGGRLIEYSAHLIPEGGVDMMPKLYGDGLLVAGDAAAMCANFGFTLRGMDLAVESGRLAAKTVLIAKEKGDFSEETLSAYQTLVNGSFIIPCIKGAEVCLESLKDENLKSNPAEIFNKAVHGI